MGFFGATRFSREDVELILREAIPLADDGDVDEAWQALAPLEDAFRKDPEAARGVAIAMSHEALDRERRLRLATELLERWSRDDDVLAALGEASETLHDHNYINAAPPDHPFFESVAKRLKERLKAARADTERIRFNNALSTAARVLGRRWDSTCEAAHRALLELRPERWEDHYNFGLFLKTRGRFEEGVVANQIAAQLAGEHVDSVAWNLGICATGAGQGDLAYRVWTEMGNKLEIGPDGLPEGGYHSVQVRLAERPLAERGGAADDPGQEETIWVERLSPCHGRVVNALYQDLGVDYGDLVLFDGAPILSRQWGDRTVPVFPHLATLRRAGWQIFWFAGTQEHQGELAALGEDLPGDALIYVHTESFRILCRSCWERSDQGHDHVRSEHRVVDGKICVPPDDGLENVIVALDEATASSEHLEVLSPGLHQAAGDTGRAEVEQRRFEMLAAD